MKLYKLVILCVIPFLSGCAGTYVSGTCLYTQANADYMEWHGGVNPSFKAYKINHSTPTRAGGSVLGTVGSSIVAGITAAIVK